MSEVNIGRRAHSPTDDDRAKVFRMCALGTPQQDMAIVMGISARTLRKHYRKELSEAAIYANLKVADTLFQMATSGKNVIATIFWAKTRNGFRVQPPTPPPTPPKQTQSPADPPPPSTIVVLNNDGDPIATD